MRPPVPRPSPVVLGPAVVGTLVLWAAAPALAQTPPLRVPQPSPRASVMQVVGLTEMTVSYSRPAVGKRKVWGDLVPYGEVWRAGANENTTLTVSTPVKVGGKSLPAGTYGLHLLPTPKEWTVILSSTSTAWGSFGYDPKEDAVRLPAQPEPAPHVERLAYSFDDPTEGSVWLALRWEKLRVAFKIEVDTPQVAMASIRRELRGLPRFGWSGWNQAAQYWLRAGGDLDEALKMAEESIRLTANFQNLRTKAAILEKKGDAKQAAELRARAMGMATEQDMNLHGYGLLQQKKIDEAIEIFQRNIKAHPDSWNVYDSLGEALAAKGDKKGAAESYGKALAMVKDDNQKKRIEQILVRLKAGR